MKAKNIYLLPIDKNSIQKVVKDAPAHVGRWEHSVDFICDEGTEVCASLGGEVVWVKDDSDVGGPDKKYFNDGNRIVMKHSDGEYSAYEHLGFRSSKVRVGDKVEAGQLIGYSGNTGYTFVSHLHFEVFRFTGPDKEKDSETLEVGFGDEIVGLC